MQRMGGKCGKTANAGRTGCRMGLLQIVHLETNDIDAELVRAELKSGAVECELTRIRSIAEMTDQLAHRPVVLVLVTRYACAYDGLRALALVRERAPETGFIFVSGPDNANALRESLGAGATDFISKDHLPKLVPSIRRVAQEKRERDLREGEEDLLSHTELLNLANDAIVISNAMGTISYWNQGAEQMYGWSREEALGRNVHALLQTGPPEQLAVVLQTLQDEHHWEGEIRQVHRDGRKIIASTGWTLQGNDPDASLLQLSIDVTSRIAAEEALRQSEERYRH